MKTERRSQQRRSAAQRLAIGVGVLFVLAFIGAGAVSVAAAIVVQSKDTTATLVGTVSRLHVHVDGDIHVETGPVGQITVATHRVWSFEEPTITETHTGTDFSISAACHGVGWGTCSTSVRLVVPPSAVLTLTSSNGDVSVDGMQGALTLESEDGNVDVTSVSGPLHLSSDHGDVSGTDITATHVQGSSDNGNVDLSFATAPRSSVPSATTAMSAFSYRMDRLPTL